MDRFELNWPGADASFFTDGWRCRIVWRQKSKRGAAGMGGTIDNNVQCVRRLADSLDGAPYLLSALKARGHERLAGQIESALEEVGPAPAVPKPSAPKRVERTPQSVSPEQSWLKGLTGSVESEGVSNRRAKVWLELGSLAGQDELLCLKTPVAKGKQEWVLKRSWPDQPKRKAEYVAAVSFKGIAGYLVGAGATAQDIERVLAALAGVAHAELEAAATAWRATGPTH